jgi:hypothetical protein
MKQATVLSFSMFVALVEKHFRGGPLSLGISIEHVNG